MEDYGGDWNRYVEAVYKIFRRNFIESQPKFQGCWVRCRRDPLEQGKEAAFWHCTSGGESEAARVPQLRRMERIGWVRAVVEHEDDPVVEVWPVRRGTDQRRCLWLQEEFIVVLAERKRKRDGFRYWQLITAYDTPEEHRRRQLRAERDAQRD
jgi:hypothetical protein